MMRPKIKKLTDSQTKALTIIRDNKIHYAAEFARLYFDEGNPGWRRISRCGAYGSSRGGGLILFAGGYLGKLRKAGLISGIGSGYQFRLTENGRDALEENYDKTD